jgi:hypothetical protein
MSSGCIAVQAFIGNAVFAGGNAVMVRFSNRDLAPLWGAGLVLGGVALLAGVYVGALRPATSPPPISSAGEVA